MRMKILNNMNPNDQPFFRRFIIAVLLLCCVNQLSFAQFATLSPQSKVSLITFGPGVDLYSGFGHSALWVYDPVAGIDGAYSYGTF